MESKLQTEEDYGLGTTCCQFCLKSNWLDLNELCSGEVVVGFWVGSVLIQGDFFHSRTVFMDLGSSKMF